MAQLDPFDQLGLMVKEHAGRELNEADTRHRVIDFVLHDLLAWPRNRTNVEEYIAPGYADYVLRKANGDVVLFVEAKKEGVFFNLPALPNGQTSGYVAIGKLLSDKNVSVAMKQVRDYCFEDGSEYAAITNGHEWVFFRIFERGKRWESLKAFVIRDLSFWEREYTKAYNSLSYTAISEDLSLADLLNSSPPQDRSIFYAKDRIPSYSHSITANRLASALRPVVNHYFGVIGDDDTEFMDRCYVSERDYQHAFDGMRSLIEDSLSPYFAAQGIQQLEDTGK